MACLHSFDYSGLVRSDGGGIVADVRGDDDDASGPTPTLRVRRDGLGQLTPRGWSWWRALCSFRVSTPTPRPLPMKVALPPAFVAAARQGDLLRVFYAASCDAGAVLSRDGRLVAARGCLGDVDFAALTGGRLRGVRADRDGLVVLGVFGAVVVAKGAVVEVGGYAIRLVGGRGEGGKRDEEDEGDDSDEGGCVAGIVSAASDEGALQPHPWTRFDHVHVL